MRTFFIGLALTSLLFPASALGQSAATGRSIGFYAGADVTQIDDPKFHRVGVTYAMPVVGPLEFYPEADLVFGNERLWQALLNVRARLPIGRDDRTWFWWYFGTGLAVRSTGASPGVFSNIQLLPSNTVQPFVEFRVYGSIRTNKYPTEGGRQLELVGGVSIPLH
jgi:hypothetical protein